MSFLASVHAQSEPARSSSRDGFVKPVVAKTLLLVVIAMASTGGMYATDSATTARMISSAGGDWANLLRAMAVLKLLFAGAATAAVMWRLGALLLHGGLIATAMLVWRDPATRARLSEIIARRQAALRARG